MREAAAEPLSQQDTEAVTAAAKVYASAVEEAQEPAHASDAGASIGQYLRQRWTEVRGAGFGLCPQNQRRATSDACMHASSLQPVQGLQCLLSCMLPCGCRMHGKQARFPSQVGRGRKAGHLWAEAWRWRERLQRAIDGCDTTDNLSAAGMAEYYELPGPNVPVTPGYSVRAFRNNILKFPCCRASSAKLHCCRAAQKDSGHRDLIGEMCLQRMAEILADGADIRYEHVVSSIRWGGEGVQLTCANGQAFHADTVIVTVSLGVLKASPAHSHDHSTLKPSKHMQFPGV